MSSLPKVAFVGAGPGDVRLLTLRGRRLLDQADVVVYDPRVEPDLLADCPASERICANAGQENLGELVAERVRAGKRVVRLVPGDPLLFGLVTEEAAALSAANIAFEIVAGVPESSAAATYAGIPVLSGVVASQALESGAPPSLASGGLAVDLAVAEVPAMAHRLMAAHWPMRTPVALVAYPATPRQTVLISTIGEITGRLTGAKLPSRLILILGDAVRQREALKWFESLPLFGRRIVVTRARHQAATFCEALRERGAQPIELPTIELCDPESFAVLDRAIAELELYDWLLFTSANGVTRFFARLYAAGRDARAIRGRICAIGPATAAELRQFGVHTDVTAAEYRAEGVLAALASDELSGKRVLIPRAAIARDVLPRELEARGAHVDVAEVYQTVAAKFSQARIARLLDDPPDVITFTSSSTVSNCPDELRVIPAASIGPITTETAKRLGFHVAVEAAEYTTEGLVRALEDYFRK